MTDGERRILDVNPRGAASLGYAPEDMVGRPWTDFVHPDDLQPTVEEAIRARSRPPYAGDFENRWKAADGSDRWMLWTGSIVPGSHVAYAVGKDITELKQAHAALRAVETRERAALTGLEEGVVLQDSTSRILVANPAARRMFGLGDVVVGHTSEDPGWETLREDGSVMPVEEQPVGRVLQTGEAQIGVVLGLRWRGGDVRWLRVSARPVEPLEEGGPAPVVSSFVDITELKRVEDELRDSEARFRSLAESSPMGVFQTDAAGKVIYSNQALDAIAGEFGDVTPDRWIETTVHREDVERVARNWAAAVAQRGPFFEDYRMCLPDGTVRWIHSRAAPVRGPRGGFVGSILDITDRVEAEAEVRASEARLQAIIDNVGAAIYVKDLEGRYKLFNRHARELLGRTAEQVLDHRDEDLMPSELAERLRVNDEQVLKAGGPLRFEERYVQGNGEEGVALTVKVALVDEDERAYAVCGVSTDITDRVRAEHEREELQARLARVERLDTVARLASGIAHDFNNLLSVIENSASVAAKHVRHEHGAREEIDEIRAAAARGAKLTRRLMLFARQEAPELVPIDLRGPLREIARTLRSLLGDDIKVRVEGDEELWRVSGDRALVEQSLINLALNARDAMPAGGSLTLSARNLEVAEGSRQDLSEGRYVRLAVTDTGHGMAPEVAALALDPFFTTKAQGQGTGLGLATVWGTATTAGGTVEVDSAPGAGTTVTMILPAAEPDDGGR